MPPIVSIPRDVYVLSGARTPFGKFGGSLKDLSAVDLAAKAISASMARAEVGPDEVGVVILGHVVRALTGFNTARWAAIRAGIPQDVPAMTVDMVCASGMQALAAAAAAISSGSVDLAVAGGMESMSSAPFCLGPEWRWGVRYSFRGELISDSLMHDGLTDLETGLLMGEEAEGVAREYGITRRESDEFAVQSHLRAAEAEREGFWKAERVSVETPWGIVERDEAVRPDTSLESVSRLRPVFRDDGILTAASSPPLSDGAAALVLSRGDEGGAAVARFLGFSAAAVETSRFPVAPVHAVRALLERLKLGVDEVDLFEVNEAFTVTPLVFSREMGVPLDRINVKGGAIALGHPLGASGARIVLTLINSLAESGGGIGVAAICHGGGGAAAAALEVSG